MRPGYTNEGTFTPDNLIAGDYPLIAEEETIVSGQNLTRGALLGKITASGKYTLSLSASADGSQTPVAILAEDTDASAADAKAPVYKTGEFAQEKVTFGTGHTAASTKEGLRDLGIFLKSTVAA